MFTSRQQYRAYFEDPSFQVLMRYRQIDELSVAKRFALRKQREKESEVGGVEQEDLISPLALLHPKKTWHDLIGQARFSLDEFARLVAISYRTEEQRDAMLGSGRSLERDQLDRGVSRDDFLDTVIAKLFNEEQIEAALQLKGVGCSVDFRKPVLFHLKGDKLKDVL